jgi:hypothetical protein
MIVTNVHQLLALDSRIEAIYSRLADLDQRRELSPVQQVSVRSRLAWQAVLLSRRRDALPGLRSLAARTLAQIAELTKRLMPLPAGVPALVRLPTVPPKG